MQIGIVGLGRMGGNMAKRLMDRGHQCVVFDLDPKNVERVAAEGATGTSSLEDLVNRLSVPRAIWVMVPAGDPTESTVMTLSRLLTADDILIDGGNSYFKDDVRRAELLKPLGIHYVDVGTSGGVWGLQRGYCLMIGGDDAAVQRIDPILSALAPGNDGIPPAPNRKPNQSTANCGYLHCGPCGSGHFVKMIHNGIEYGVMQAYAEGFNILFNADSPNLPENLRFRFALQEIAEVWRHGSVISSWLLDLAAISLTDDPVLQGFRGFVEDTGEGRWTVVAALEEAVPADVLSASVHVRFRSRQEHVFAEKLLSAMRFQFGGHKETPIGGNLERSDKTD